MIKDKEISRLCFYYEMFMERAHGTYETGTPGTHAQNMQRLIMAEEEKKVSMKSVVHFEDLLLGIKKHLEEALIKYIEKPHVSREIIDELIRTKEQVVWIVSSDELMEIVFKTIDLTVSIPLDME